MKSFLFCILITLPCLFNSGLAEVFTALVDLKEVLHTEEVLIQTLDTYIRAEKTKLNLIEKYLDLYKKQHHLASGDVETYISNPINAYLLVKRLTADWKQIESLLQTNFELETLANISSYKEYLLFPTDEDLNGAAVALTRLQDTYKLDTSSLARGELNGVKYSSELSATDCFELGRQSYNNGDFYHTQLWMTEADSRLGKEVNETVDKTDILEYLAFSTFKMGNIHLALDLTHKLLEMYPDHPRASSNVNYYEAALATSESARKKGDDNAPDVPIASDMSMFPDGLEPPERTLYEQLCRKEITLPVEITSKLKCYFYNRNGNPFLLIAPFKVEEAYRDPDVFIFHDVMFDDEIETIKSMARPRFKRATVQNHKTGELETAQYRISKSAWLKDFEHKYVENVVKRVLDMTGLTMETAEELQVVNYGIGGHYEPHYDFARKDEENAFKSLGTGNRIATVLFYMTDVMQGGATVFPSLKLALWPKKGSAAFWYNLHPSGDGNILTRHAACPVLAGTKWVSNKWIHERGQEFRRPCNLKPPPPELTI